MKGKFLLISTLLPLALTPSAFASNYTPTSTARPTHQEFSPTGTIEIAQQYRSAEYIASRLKNLQRQIVAFANQQFGGRLKWKNISVEIINNDRIKLNLHGQASIGGPLVKDPTVRIGLILQRDRQGNFKIVGYDYRVHGNYAHRVGRELDKKLKETIPNLSPVLQQMIDTLLR